MKLKLTKNQIIDLAKKIFNESFSEDNYNPKWNDCDTFIRNDWYNVALDAIEGYNNVAKYVSFSGMSIVRNCCRICAHVDLIRPACNLRGDDIDLECVCSRFELFEFYGNNDEEGDEI